MFCDQKGEKKDYQRHSFFAIKDLQVLITQTKKAQNFHPALFQIFDPHILTI